MSNRTQLRRALIGLVTLTAVVATMLPASATFPDQGKRILFIRQKGLAPARGATGLDLFTMKPNGDDQRRVIRTDAVQEYGGHWSPDGSHLVYAGIKGKGDIDIYSARADGTHRDALATTKTNFSPNWSKNGQQIVWTRVAGVLRQVGPARFELPRGDADADLMVMDANGTQKESIFSGLASSPGWSPTRALIAFSTSDADSLDIWTVKPNGQGLDQLTDYGAGTTTIFGDWSPDGDSFAFMRLPATMRGMGGDFQLWVASATNPNADVFLAAGVAEQFAPVYTVDGSRVIFVRNEGGGDYELYSVKTDGTGERQLTDNAWADVLTVIPLFF